MDSHIHGVQVYPGFRSGVAGIGYSRWLKEINNWQIVWGFFILRKKFI